MPELRKRIKPLYVIAVICLTLLASALLVGLSAIDPAPFHASFESGSLSTADWQIDAHPECRIEFASGFPSTSNTFVRIEAPQNARCELVPRIFPPILEKLRREPYEEVRSYRFQVRIEDSNPASGSIDLGENTIIAQWHASSDPFIAEISGRGPPLALRIQNGKWAITYGWDAEFRSTEPYLASNWQWAGPVETGKWVEWRFKVRWSHREDGFTQVWRDDEIVFERSGPNAYNDLRGVYLKLGIYHPTSDMSIQLDEVSITTPGSEGG